MTESVKAARGAGVLREQAPLALRELASGFPGADAAGLVSAILRLVVVLFASSRGLFPGDDLGALHAELTAADRASLADRHDAWPRVLALFRHLHEGFLGQTPPPGPARRGSLFDADAYPFLEGPLSDAVVLRILDKLLLAAGERLAYAELDVEHLGTVYETLMGFSEERRRLGAHYTSPLLTRIMVERTLAPLVRPDASAEEILGLSVCDPAMGAGAFLVQVCRWLADRLVAAWERAGMSAPEAPDEDPQSLARRRVAEVCLYGVDRNPIAVDLARVSLWLLTAPKTHPFLFLEASLRHGDSLVGLGREEIENVSPAPVRERLAEAATARRRFFETANPDLLAEADRALAPLRTVGHALLAAHFASKDKKAQKERLAALPDLAARYLTGEGLAELEAEAAALAATRFPFHWHIELPEVFGRGGFDAFVGNPPWVSYAGRAAQPLADDLREFYRRTNPAFAGYRNLQGLFVHQCARMLRPGGRLGLVLPTSMSDLGGYEPSRRAHDVLCVCDDELPDFGDAFEGVFQPSMGLLSTRRNEKASLGTALAWPLARSDLDAETAALLEKLSALPKLPPHLFGERGFQSNGDDVRHLHEREAPDGRFQIGLRVGGDIEPFSRRPPRLYCDPTDFSGRFRKDVEWLAVRLLIRQTARFPMVALSDGIAFRNSILAGFSDDQWSAAFLLGWLNASPIRFYHYMRHRDARQGMPQVKITHLRALPAPAHPELVPEIEAFAGHFGTRNQGISRSEQDTLDDLVARALGVAPPERGPIERWARTVTPDRAPSP
ncbi:Eco57I restriction-modification methylase domain-containing protein [Polyangium jinanense]|uniref:Eco57I restriction-modification methylase domain-containing protein n=1 Tax=Polyangium jinanense TaxID=2829994 RepID=UPI002340A2C7|nr:N-6 DNA methylase [Polyangium jinanense]